MNDKNEPQSICPLLSSSNTFEPCIREKCAWWYGRTKECAMVAIASGGDALAEAVFGDSAIMIDKIA